MSENKCPKCNSEIEEGWHVCWNCQYEIPENIIEQKAITTPLNEDNPEVEFVLVDKQKIIQAGKQLKMIVKLVLFSILIAIVSTILFFIIEKEQVLVIGGVFILAMYIAQLVNLFQAGSDLIKSVQSKK